MSLIKKLAGQTAIYGVSSILGRVLNYMLVPLHTAFFVPAQMGKITELYAYVALLNIIYTYGMETAYFRFAAKNNSLATYRIVGTAVLATSIIFSGIIFLLAQPIANYLDYNDSAHIIRWLAIILGIDAIAAIPFARLRLENKAKKFAIAKVSVIGITIVFNIIFIYFLPKFSTFFAEMLIQFNISTDVSWAQKVFFLTNGITPKVGFVFLANLIGNATLIFWLRKELLQLKPKFSWQAFKPMFVYALPIFIAGLAAMANEQVDKILFKHIFPSDDAQAFLGIYGAVFKLSIFMALAVQAFRYAGEPFFFSQAHDKNSPALFAKIMYYFVIACCIILVGVSLNIELIGHIFLRNEAYWEALPIVPILLTGKLFLGIYFNLSIWFKLTDKTYFGAIIAFIGTIITIIANLALVPTLGYWGAAIANFLYTFTICAISYFLSKKYYPIPYPLMKIGIYIITALLYIGIMFLISAQLNRSSYYLNILATAVYLFIIFLVERKKIKKTT